MIQYLLEVILSIAAFLAVLYAINFILVVIKTFIDQSITPGKFTLRRLTNWIRK
jgi:hypothetical protein